MGKVNTNHCFQRSWQECGAAALSIVLNYYGKEYSLDEICDSVGVTEAGYSAGGISRAAKHYGLECRGFRKKSEKLESVKKPCIVYWNENRFLVLEGFESGYAYLNDPAFGHRKLSMSEFENGYSQIVLEFSMPIYHATYKSTTTLMQRSKAECGAACLGMILDFWGKKIPLDQLCIASGTTQNGCNAGGLIRAAKKYGLIPRGYRCCVQELYKFPTPSIIHWDFNHFVVFEGVENGLMYINDPAVGHQTLSLGEFEERFTGTVLIFETSNKK